MAASTLYKKAVSLAPKVNEDFLELADLLRQLYEEDNESYRQVVANTDLGSRKAYYLVEISRAFADKKVDPDRLVSIGWSKLKEIAKFVTPANMEDLLQQAEGSTVNQLAALMRGEKPIEKAKVITLFLSPTQYKKFHEILLKNGATRASRGLIDKEKALMRVFSKYEKAVRGE